MQENFVLTRNGGDMSAGNSASPTWESLGTNGTQVLRVWQLEDRDKYPHIALLRVSSATYQGYAQNPRSLVEFANANQIFPDTLKGSGPWVALASFGHASTVPGYILTLVHQKACLIGVTAHPDIP